MLAPACISTSTVGAVLGVVQRASSRTSRRPLMVLAAFVFSSSLIATWRKTLLSFKARLDCTSDRSYIRVLVSATIWNVCVCCFSRVWTL